MRRFLGFLLRLTVIVIVVGWLCDQPGTARIVWHDYVIDTSAAFLGLCSLAAGFVFYLLYRFWRFLRHGPERWRLRRKLDRLQKGQDYLTAGLIAVAGGNAIEAGRRAVQARKYLGSNIATQLLQAQAAQLAGDFGAAEEMFLSLSEKKESAVVGYRGLIMAARRAGDWDEVTRLTSKLHETHPHTPWLQVIRFELLARAQDWQEAGQSLLKAAAARLIEPAQARRAQAALMIALSQSDAGKGRRDGALQAAEQASRHRPDWLPVILNLAAQQANAGQERACRRTVERAWPHHPHPQLALIYRGVVKDGLQGYKQLERLCAQEEDPTNRMVLADAALAADIWGEARRHLIALVSRRTATCLTYRLLAKLERRESGDEQAALHWLIKATDALPDATWLCQNCGGAQDRWRPLCAHCGEFDKLEWQRPGISHSHRPAAAQNLIAQDAFLSHE